MRADPNAPPLLGRAARAALTVVLVAAAIAVVGYAVAQLRLLVVAMLVALLVSTLLVAPADRLRAKGVPSAVATLLMMALAAAVAAAAVAAVGPSFVDQLDDVGGQARAGLEEAVTWLVQGPLNIDRATLDSAVDDALASLEGRGGELAGGLLTGAVLVAELIAGLLLATVITFFFVHDGRRIWAWLVAQAPSRRREALTGAGERIWGMLTGYVRGVVIIAVIDALAVGLALVLIGVPLVVPLMVLTFFGAFLPLIGAVAAGAVAALVALVSGGPVDALLVVAAVTIIQQLEGDLLYPVIVGRAIDLHPLAILLLLTAGAIVAGIVGALLAVPAGAAAWIAVQAIRDP